jgi:DNA-binding MarR family transcriptional regulator
VSTPNAAPVNGMQDMHGLWLTISELARQRGVDKAAISRRVKRLEAQGALRPQLKDGSKLVNLAEYDRAVGQTTDAVRELNGSLGGAPAADADPVLAREQARRAAYDADLKKLDLDERLGKLVPVEDVENAMARCGETIVRAVERLSTRADELAAAVAKDGVAGARAAIKAMARDLRETIARALTLAAEEEQGEAP